jgi:hypothetical protein
MKKQTPSISIQKDTRRVITSSSRAILILRTLYKRIISTREARKLIMKTIEKFIYSPFQITTYNVSLL